MDHYLDVQIKFLFGVLYWFIVQYFKKWEGAFVVYECLQDRKSI